MLSIHRVVMNFDMYVWKRVYWCNSCELSRKLFIEIWFFDYDIFFWQLYYSSLAWSVWIGKLFPVYFVLAPRLTKSNVVLGQYFGSFNFPFSEVFQVEFGLEMLRYLFLLGKHWTSKNWTRFFIAFIILLFWSKFHAKHLKTFQEQKQIYIKTTFC